MGLCVRVVRGLALCWVVLGGILVGTGIIAVAWPDAAVAQTVNSIAVEGNRRVESETIRSYFHAGPNGQLSPVEIDAGLKSLYATGLFEDVHISRPGGRIVVTVVEAPVINQVAFEGNKKAKDDQLRAEVQSKARGTLSKATVQSDVQRIVEIYQRSGRFDVSVNPKIIELPNNRVNLVFEIKEGEKTGIKEINFVGEQLAQLPADNGHLRPRPHRSGPRPAASILSAARLRRCAHHLGNRRLRPCQERVHCNFRHR